MKNYVSLLICSFGLASCLTTPGFKEPNITECTIYTDAVECIDYKTKKVYNIPIEDLIGYTAISPQDLVKVKNHHDALHEVLNQCEKRDK